MVEIPTFKDRQPIVEEITSLDEEAETESEEIEESTSEKGTKSFIRDKDFEVFYCPDETEEEASSSRLAAALVNENQEATKELEEMVIEKRLSNLVSLLESHARTITPKVPIVPKHPTPIPPPPSQT